MKEIAGHRRLLSLSQSGDVSALEEALSEHLASSSSLLLSDIVHHKTGDGLLHVAARGGHVSCIKLLLGLGLGVDTRNLEFKTPLHEAAQCGQLAAVRQLLGAGAAVDSLKRADWTPVMLAATRADNEATVRALVEAGADLRVRNKDGWSCLQVAARAGDLATVRLLREASPDTATSLTNNGRTLLHTACLAGHREVMCYLLQLPEVRASLNAGDSCGNTPLMEAARARHLACVRELLLLPDTELGTRDKMGRTVVQVAAQAGAVEVLELLRQEHGLEVTTDLSLHSAAREGQLEVIRSLVAWGAEVDSRDSWGRTPLFLAVSGQHCEAARLLLEAGARLEVEDSSGNTLVQLARRPDLVQLIREYS